MCGRALISCLSVLLLSLLQAPRRSRADSEDCLGGNRKVLNAAVRRLEFPLSFSGRIAMLEAGFDPESQAREFAATDLRGLEAFAPQSLVAPIKIALELADQKLRGYPALASLDVALVVLTHAGDPVLDEYHRDLLWRAFGVPVFEQLRDSDGLVIARECEVHDGLHLEAGLHLEDGAPLPGALRCEMISGHCECGAETRRLRRLAPLRTMAAAAAA